MPTAIITGATQGIGKAIAEKMLQQGCDIAICARTASDLATLQTEWAQQYPDRKIIVAAVDVAEKDALVQFATMATQALGNIDVLVNNAGIFMPGLLATEEEGLLEYMMQINLYSAYHLTRAILPNMHQHGSGHIFNMSSVAGLQAYQHGGSYSITKYALKGFSDNLREELKNSNIKVTCVSPGATYTRSWSGSGVSEERIMLPQDVADMVWAAYNLSPQANVEHIVLRPVKGDL